VLGSRVMKLHSLSHPTIKIIFNLLFIIAPLSGEGFLADTLVSTARGYIPIQEIIAGDSVFCSSFEGSCEEGIVIATSQKVVHDCVCVVANTTPIFVEANHLFYVAHEKRWCPAQSLTPGQKLLSSTMFEVAIDDVYAIESEHVLYSIAVQHYNTYCITEHDIIVHNFFFVIPVLAWGAGAGITFLEGVSIAGLTTSFIAAVGLSLVEK
jgi:hypothetical protein